ncbi:MAG: GPW/gp25 family protein [Chromatiales bacterium]|nr:GPW/gp25 family protein [Gammaproteobacteria bacterium]
MSRTEGQRIAGLSHLRQSITDILTMPVGSRVMRRDYGSRLFELVDAPLDGSTLVALFAATAEALDRWEPRFRLDRVQVQSGEPGRVVLLLQGQYLPDGREVTMEGLIV